MKKFLALLLAVVMVLSLAACGKRGSWLRLPRKPRRNSLLRPRLSSRLKSRPRSLSKSTPVRTLSP